MSSLLVFLAFLSIVLSSNAQSSSMETKQLCGTNEDDSCSSCFNRLAYEAIKTSENQYNLQRAFFPPDKETPVYVIVTYRYVNDNGTIMESENTWFWSTSTYYLYQPPAVLQFTSLFFADPSFRSRRLTLTLPSDCIDASIDFMQLLTQRLERFAGSRSVYPSINTQYDAVAENFETLNNFIKEHGHVIQYLIATHVVFFVAAVAFVVITFIYIFCGKHEDHKNSYIYKVFESFDQENDIPTFTKCNLSDLDWYDMKCTIDDEGGDAEKVAVRWAVKTTLNMIFSLSMIITLYILLMSILGQSIGNSFIEKRENLEIKEIFTRSKDSLKELYAITPIILSFDCGLVIVLIIIIGVLSVYGCFIKNTWWLVCLFSPALPIAMIIVHLTHIIIGFIHNERHATSVGVFYIGAVVLQIALFKLASKLYFTCATKDDDEAHCSSIDTHVAIFGVVHFFSAILAYGVLAFAAALYFLLPIRNAFDEAPNRLNTIISGVTLLLGSYAVYLLVKVNKNVEEKD